MERKDAILKPDKDDNTAGIVSWYWICMAVDWVKYCGLHVQTKHVQLKYLLSIVCVR